MTTYKKRTVYQFAGEKIKQTLQWGAALADNDTISSVTNTASGVTVTSESNDTTSSSYYASGVSGVNGYVTTKIVTAGNETLYETIYFIERTQ